MERNTNLHHVFWPKRGYKGNFEKNFRTANGLVIPTLITKHADLHHDMHPPKKPSRDLMFEIRGHLEETLLIDRLDGLVATIDLVSEIDTREAQYLAGHLTRQMGYLALQEARV